MFFIFYLLHFFLFLKLDAYEMTHSIYPFLKLESFEDYAQSGSIQVPYKVQNIVAGVGFAINEYQRDSLQFEMRLSAPIEQKTMYHFMSLSFSYWKSLSDELCFYPTISFRSNSFDFPKNAIFEYPVTLHISSLSAGGGIVHNFDLIDIGLQSCFTRELSADWISEHNLFSSVREKTRCNGVELLTFLNLKLWANGFFGLEGSVGVDLKRTWKEKSLVIKASHQF